MPDESLFAVPQELLILGAAVKTGIVEALHGKPMTVEDLARELNCNARAVWMVTEALAELGYLVRENGRLRLDDQSASMFYDENAPNYTGFAFMHRYNIIKAWIHLPDIIRTGIPYPKEKETPDLPFFLASMARSALQGSAEIAGFCLAGYKKGARVLDIGGGPLTYARAFAALGAQVTILDLPPVVDYMSSFLKENENIEMLPGDFNLGLPQGPYDLVFMGNICHIVGESGNKGLFKKAANVLPIGGKAAIIDFIRGTGPQAAVFGVNMLANTPEGGVWSFEQYSTWLAEAGFGEVVLHELAGRQLLLAVKVK
ncbi:O-methyltransferase [Pelotomaculum schinkii]|uniref:O-methyltransferase n=1 Tax=Pelotomaculum schinkii TaxID=78350 RepID=A0A4Y7RFH2_9FIRM|nr:MULTISPECIES: methyltransferase [Pelotomaculum]TEB07067.1 O-methyltransferase [Pelotomaculum schinkii]TEB16982.1 O-methyltransferase [Pelotomaculum sp. FP]